MVLVQLQAMPKLVIGCKKDMISANVKRPTMLNEFRSVDSIEAVGIPCHSIEASASDDRAILCIRAPSRWQWI